jgi:hypothetical protein
LLTWKGIDCAIIINHKLGLDIAHKYTNATHFAVGVFNRQDVVGEVSVKPSREKNCPKP